jgi:voltage-dependent potassium channel beta subunit
MQYNRMGSAGLKLSELSFGSWLTFGRNLDLDNVRACMRAAYGAGVNFFDNAEVYGNGAAELLMGEALRDFRREDVVVSTKIFWGGKGPNDEGLSAKRLVEGTLNALRRLRLDYVDLLYCHRPDPNTPIEESVRALDRLVRRGCALYWGTSEWSADQIREAHRVAREIHAVPPSVEQPCYNMFTREKVEREFAPLYAELGMGATTFSPLASGLLTGKYNAGIPPGSRLDREEWLRSLITPERVAQVQALARLAGELGATSAQLAIAWCLRNPHVSSVIIGASSLEQLRENLGALAVKERLTAEVMARIEEILGNRPQ